LGTIDAVVADDGGDDRSGWDADLADLPVDEEEVLGDVQFDEVDLDALERERFGDGCPGGAGCFEPEPSDDGEERDALHEDGDEDDEEDHVEDEVGLADTGGEREGGQDDGDRTLEPADGEQRSVPASCSPARGCRARR
jgi:hypothetical protein